MRKVVTLLLVAFLSALVLPSSILNTVNAQNRSVQSETGQPESSNAEPIVENVGQAQAREVDLSDVPKSTSAPDQKFEGIPSPLIKEGMVKSETDSQQAAEATAVPVVTPELINPFEASDDSAAPEPQIPGVTNVYGGFDGLNEADSGGFPPDVTMGVGPNHIVVATNFAWRIYDKAGNNLYSATLDGYMGHTGTFDPKVYYDTVSNRFFTSAATRGTGHFGISIAVTDDSDPFGSYCFYHVHLGTASTTLVDQPIIGSSADKVMVSVNDFTATSFEGYQYVILDKAAMLTCQTSNFNFNSPDNTHFSVHPAYNFDGTNDIFAYENRQDVGLNQIEQFNICGAVPSAGVCGTFNIDVGAYSSIPTADQPSSTRNIETGDHRIQDAVLRGGNVWLAGTDGCVVNGLTRSCIRLDQIDPDHLFCPFGFCFVAPQLLQDFNVGTSSDNFFMYPGVTTDGAGNMGFVFAVSGPSTFGSVAACGQAVGDPANSVTACSFVRFGSAATEDEFPAGRFRYGDYQAAMIDPTLTSIIWIAGEYIPSFSNWATWINQIRISGSAVRENVNVTLDPISPQNLPWGGQITASGRLTMANYGTPIPSRSVGFTGTGAGGLPSDLTDFTGAYSSTGPSPSAVGTQSVQATFAGDAAFNAGNSGVQNYGTLAHSTTLVLDKPANRPWGTATTFVAHLTDNDNSGAPIPGKSIHFTGTGVIGVADATTDSSGTAVGSGTAPNTVQLGWRARAQFAGDSLYTASNSLVKYYNTLKHSTTLTLVITPSTVAHGGTYKVVATLKDSTLNSPLASKTITFTAESPITIASKVTDSFGKATRTGLRAPATPGSYDIQAHFAGDALYKARHSAIKVLTVT